MTTSAEKIQQQIEKLATKLAQQQARDQLKAQREKAKDATAKRKADTRRKVLAGALVLELMASDPERSKTFRALLNTFLTRPDDRKLFDLPALETRADGEPVTGVPAIDNDNTHPGN